MMQGPSEAIWNALALEPPWQIEPTWRATDPALLFIDKYASIAYEYIIYASLAGASCLVCESLGNNLAAK